MKKILLLIILINITCLPIFSSNNDNHYIGLGFGYNYYITDDTNNPTSHGPSLAFKGEDAFFNNPNVSLFSTNIFSIPLEYIKNYYSGIYQNFSINMDSLTGINYKNTVSDNLDLYFGCGLHFNFLASDFFDTLSYKAGIGVNNGIKTKLTNKLYIDFEYNISLDFMKYFIDSDNPEVNNYFVFDYLGSNKNAILMLTYKI